MAIRFVDVEPEKARPKAERRTPAPPVPAADRAETAPAVTPGEPGDGSAALPHGKPLPKPRGRKARAPAANDKVNAGDGVKPEAETVDGLLPGLQVHAKPTPKPRGRKKAFG